MCSPYDNTGLPKTLHYHAGYNSSPYANTGLNNGIECSPYANTGNPPIYKAASLLLLAAALSACNQNDQDIAQPDTTKPVITLNQPQLITGVQLSTTTPVSFVIADVGRLSANDNSGNATLSVVDVVGLLPSQITLTANGVLRANNIASTAAVGRGYVDVQATDSSKNSSRQRVYFDVSPVLTATQAKVVQGQSVSLRFPVMVNTQAASVAVDSASGVSGSAYLEGNEVVVNLSATAMATVGSVSPQVLLTTQTGQVFKVFLTVGVIIDAPTEFAQPSLTVDANGVVTGLYAGISDADGTGTMTVFANGTPVAIGTKLKPGSYLITSQ